MEPTLIQSPFGDSPLELENSPIASWLLTDCRLHLSSEFPSEDISPFPLPPTYDLAMLGHGEVLSAMLLNLFTCRGLLQKIVLFKNIPMFSIET